MTPTEPHRSASPPEGIATSDRPTAPLSVPSYDPGRRSHRHRRAWAPEIALLTTSLAISPPTKRSSASIEPRPQRRLPPLAPIKSP